MAFLLMGISGHLAFWLLRSRAGVLMRLANDSVRLVDGMLQPGDEDEKLEEGMERRRAEGGSFQAEISQQVPELVVQERVSQSRKVKVTEENKKVRGWSTEEMKEKPNRSLEEDTGELTKSRS